MTTEQLLEAMTKTITLVRTLMTTNTTTTFGEYTRIVGIRKPDEAWHIQHRELARHVLNLAAAIARENGDALEYERITNARTGQPGSGVHHENIVVQHRDRLDA